MLENFQNVPKVQKWIEKMEKLSRSINLKNITIDKAHMFGANLGFLNFTVDAETKDGNFIPGISVIRGDSVFMLTILEEEETTKEWFVLTQQTRIPVAERIFEIPAGMIDEETGNISAVALKELVEEVGEELSPCIEDLTLLRKGNTYTSPGLLDENAIMYLFRKKMPAKEIEKFNGKRSGLAEEDISLMLIEESEFMNKVDSMAAITAFLLYKGGYKA